MKFRKYLLAAAVATAMSGVVGVPASHAVVPAITKSLGIGYYSGCAVQYNDTVKCWGEGWAGQLGTGDTSDLGDEPNEMGDNLPTVDLGTGRTAKAVAGGYEFTCAILDNNTVKCWGSNYYGQLGLGATDSRGDASGEMGDNLPAVDLGAGRTAKALALGLYHACAILDNNTVKCWGHNSSGALGLGDTDNRGDSGSEMGDNLPAINLGAGRTAKAIGAGEDFTCALLDNNTVKCWGKNNVGQLGQGATDDRGDSGSEMGDNLPAIDLGTGRTAKAIAVGHYHVCAILDNNAVKCWGQNPGGVHGQGDTTDRGDNGGEMGDNLPAIDLGTGRTPKAITSGEQFSCALLDNNTVKCWGQESDGQLGQEANSNLGDNANELGDNLPAIDLGTGRTAKAISAGYHTVCALLDNDLVKCWGDNEYGHLGQGDDDSTDGDRGDEANEMGDSLKYTDLGTMPDLPPAGANTFVLLVAALGLLGSGSIVLIARRRTV